MKAEFPDAGSINFNPTLVQLEDGEKILCVGEYFAFQSHIGAIRSKVRIAEVINEKVDFNPTLVQLEAHMRVAHRAPHARFQSHIGAIRRGILPGRENVHTRFQSHIGAIRRNSCASPNPSSSHFNPTLVQLEAAA